MEAWLSFLGSVLVAIISLTGVVYTSKKQHSSTIAEVTTQIALMRKDIENLDEKVQKHNGVIERTYALESAVTLLDEQVKVANHRIEDLEKGA